MKKNIMAVILLCTGFMLSNNVHAKKTMDDLKTEQVRQDIRNYINQANMHKSNAKTLDIESARKALREATKALKKAKGIIMENPTLETKDYKNEIEGIEKLIANHRKELNRQAKKTRMKESKK